MNPTAEETHQIHHLMMFHIPKITIYRIDNFKPEAPT